MRQQGDALSWGIPVPGVGRVLEAAMPRAVERIGSGAAAQAERSIGNSAAAKMPGSEVAPGRVELISGDESTALRGPQPEEISKQPTKPIDDTGEPPAPDPKTPSDVSTSSPLRGGHQTTRSPRKSKLERKMAVEIAKELFARDPSRVEHPGAKFGDALTNNYRKGYAQANPEVNMDDLVIHHPAEQQLLDRLSFLSERKINSVENLRGIPKDLNDILHLSIIRSENDEFYARYPNPTEQQILDHSTMMDKKYGHHFVPPVGRER